MVRKSSYGLKRGWCEYAIRVSETKDNVRGFGCKLDKDKIAYPSFCEAGTHKNCWRLKCGTS